MLTVFSKCIKPARKGAVVAILFDRSRICIPMRFARPIFN
jgi:hypothetical protein